MGPALADDARGLDRAARRRPAARPRPVRGVLPLPPRRGRRGHVRGRVPARGQPARPAGELPRLDPRGRARAARPLQGPDPVPLRQLLRIDHLEPRAPRAAIEGPSSATTTSSRTASRCEIEPELVDAVLDAGRRRARRLGGRRRRGNGGRTTARRATGRDALPPARADGGSGTRRMRRARASCGSTLEPLGGAERIVRTPRRGAAALTPAERDLAAAVFHYLVTPSGTKIASRSRDLADYAGAASPSSPPRAREAGRRRPILRPVDRRRRRRRAALRDLPRRPRAGDPRLACRARAGAGGGREEARGASGGEADRGAAAAGLAAARRGLRGLAVWAVGQKRTAEEKEADAAAAADRAGSAAVAGRATRRSATGPGGICARGAPRRIAFPRPSRRGASLSSLHLNAAIPRSLGHSSPSGQSRSRRTDASPPGSDDWTVRLWDEDGRPLGETRRG